MASENWLMRTWYDDGVAGWLLAPLGWAYGRVATTRRNRWLRSATTRLPVPVIVVGNLTVGGTGKTPLVIWLVERLQEAGWRPGIVTRGYGGRAKRWPQAVRSDSNPVDVGDEAVLLARRTKVPVVAAPDRVAAVRAVVGAGADIVVSDDGLQHYRLPRQLEIVVVDGARGFGNGRCLPAGPLREPLHRLEDVDFVVVNGHDECQAVSGAIAMTIEATEAYSLVSGQRRSLASFGTGPVHAVAGIGNPARFFATLRTAGLGVRPHPFPDHHPFVPGDLEFDDELPVLMTEKDAVKCESFGDERLWAVPATATLDPVAAGRLQAGLGALAPGRVKP